MGHNFQNWISSKNGSSPGSAPSVWSVVITNDTSGQSMSVLNQGVNLSVSLRDGTYAYRIVPVSGFTSTPSYGTLTVDNAYYLIKVIFKSTLVHMVFKERLSPTSVPFITNEPERLLSEANVPLVST